MTFIDWSDADEMFGLLCEYIADERAYAKGDAERRRFLAELGDELADLAQEFSVLPEADAIAKLQEIHRSQPAEFADDHVLVHVHDCIAELERILRNHEQGGAGASESR